MKVWHDEKLKKLISCKKHPQTTLNPRWIVNMSDKKLSDSEVTV